MDTISAGGVIAWAIETAEQGLLSGLDIESGAGSGIDAPLRFGDGETVIALLDDIGHRRGYLGNLLADGSRLAAEQVGGGAASWAMQVKGARAARLRTPQPENPGPGSGYHATRRLPQPHLRLRCRLFARR